MAVPVVSGMASLPSGFAIHRLRLPARDELNTIRPVSRSTDGSRSPPNPSVRFSTTGEPALTAIDASA